MYVFVWVAVCLHIWHLKLMKTDVSLIKSPLFFQMFDV